jgi:hypothetical protein
MSKIQLFNEDCLTLLRRTPEHYIDSLITDPPAGISFMNKEWDNDKGGRDGWIAWLTEVARECYRVMKPGAHGLVWAIPRTSHWTATALENAGFEVRDVVTHLFGTGFPKSLNLEKATNGVAVGQGTALKPASEHWILIRKPISEKTVAANVLKWGVGGLNIDASRIATSETLSSGRHTTGDQQGPSGYKTTNRSEYVQAPQGRFPTNLILDEDAAKALDEQSGSGYPGVSRFFYAPKASISEKNAGIDGKNSHPTVKSLKLMEYLIKLISPPGGRILDPFMGSGSTGAAAKSGNFDFLGIEKELEYYNIARQRIQSLTGK